MVGFKDLKNAYREIWKKITFIFYTFSNLSFPFRTLKTKYDFNCCIPARIIKSYKNLYITWKYALFCILRLYRIFLLIALE